MIQNSLSPVVKSRISSSSGRTINVEKRNLARTGTMSSLEYFTTRASSVAARTAAYGKAEVPKTTTAANRIQMGNHRLRIIDFIVPLLWRMFDLFEHRGLVW